MKHLQVVKTTQYCSPFTFNFFHNTPIIFVTLLTISSRIFEILPQKSSVASRVPYVYFLDSVYMNCFADIYINEVTLIGWFYLLE